VQTGILFLAIAAGAVVFLLGRKVVSVVTPPDVSGKLGRAEGQAKAVKGTEKTEDAVGRLVRRYFPGYVRSVASDLYWIAFSNNVEASPASPELPRADQLFVSRMVTRQIAMSLTLGVAAVFAFESNFALILGAAAGWFIVRSDLAGRADRIRGRIAQEVPEFLQLMAAEAAAGGTLASILANASRGISLTAAWFRAVLSRAHGISLFTSTETAPEGLLRFEAERSEHYTLVDVAIQLEYVKKGVQVRDLLRSMAVAMQDDFITQADTRAEKLSNTLGAVSALFFVVPFMLTVLVVVGAPAMTTIFK
jgi:Flp pilus assembly protein TadB